MTTQTLVAGAFAQLAAANFKGAGRRLDDIDLPTIGASIGVGEDELHAILDVESSGVGFDAQGRPKMLFEPHVFFRLLDETKRARAVRAGLAYEKWGALPYPKDSYPRLVQALALDETAALKSASWGLTQIMGENHWRAGFASVQAMVATFADDEAAQLDATAQLIKAMGLAGALKARDWPKVAKGWNGSQYRKNAYDTKLATAFARWAKRPDTPFPARAGAEHLALPAAVPASPVALLGAWFSRLLSPAARAA